MSDAWQARCDDDAERTDVGPARQRRGFVKVIPDSFRTLSRTKRLDFDAQSLLRAVTMDADWQTATLQTSQAELRNEYQITYYRLDRALKCLSDVDCIDYSFPRGQRGYIRILIYNEIVHGWARATDLDSSTIARAPAEGSRDSRTGSRDSRTGSRDSRTGSRDIARDHPLRPASLPPVDVDVVDEDLTLAGVVQNQEPTAPLAEGKDELRSRRDQPAVYGMLLDALSQPHRIELTVDDESKERDNVRSRRCIISNVDKLLHLGWPADRLVAELTSRLGNVESVAAVILDRTRSRLDAGAYVDVEVLARRDAVEARERQLTAAARYGVTQRNVLLAGDCDLEAASEQIIRTYGHDDELLAAARAALDDLLPSDVSPPEPAATVPRLDDLARRRIDGVAAARAALRPADSSTGEPA